MKELVLAIVRPCFLEFDEWAVELVELAIDEDVEVDELIDYIFRFRMLVINFIEGCPIELVDHVYTKQILNALCSEQELESLPSSAI